MQWGKGPSRAEEQRTKEHARTFSEGDTAYVGGLRGKVTFVTDHSVEVKIGLAKPRKFHPSMVSKA